MNKWDQRFLEQAQAVSQWSKDPSTKVGAVLARGKRLVAVGFNGFPEDMSDAPHLYENREKKYARVIHAEMNTIANAAKEGASTEGCTIYTWPFPPCSNCAKHLIQFGIIRVMAPKLPPELERWRADCIRAAAFFEEAKREIIYI